tara:strand:+ start:13570 stop:14625 length:1056 start_codon:yes stop_codon:yes gene_type:complete
MDSSTKMSRLGFLKMAALSYVATETGNLNILFNQNNNEVSEVNLSDDSKILSFGILKNVIAGLLDVGYAEKGPVNGQTVILLHGWPYDIHSYAEVASLLEAKGYRIIIPYLRGYGTTRFLSDESFRNGQQAALAMDIIAFMDALKIGSAIIGGFDWGARSANIIAALWPERCSALVSVSGYLIGSQQIGQMPLSPKAELSWWYQFYFATDRGYLGYKANRRDFAKLIWELGSPDWSFSQAIFEQSAQSLYNPDHVDIVIHNYRWRLGVGKSESIYNEIEKILATKPIITVPTVTLEGDANGAPHSDPATYAAKFTGRYAHHNITGGVGHNLPQEAPKAFADAIIEAHSYIR